MLDDANVASLGRVRRGNVPERTLPSCTAVYTPPKTTVELRFDTMYKFNAIGAVLVIVRFN